MEARPGLEEEEEVDEEDVEVIEAGSLGVSEPRPIMGWLVGTGDWAAAHTELPGLEPKLASKLTSEPELAEYSREERLLDMQEAAARG
jgi:hypothetical protein